MACRFVLLVCAGLVAAHASNLRNRVNSPRHLGESVPLDCPSGVVIAESIPLGVNLTTDLSTHDAFVTLINNAQSTLDVAAFYFSLTDGLNLPGGEYGIAVYNAIMAAAKRGVYVRFVVNIPTALYPQTDVFSLVAAGAVDAQFINFTQLSGLSGVLHTKFMIADHSAMYVGSANMDWRSLAHVKELGLYYANCSSVASELNKIFQVYWRVASTSEIPNPWPMDVYPSFNLSNPGSFQMNGSATNLYLSMAPPFLRPPQWTPDEVAITDCMFQAQTVVRFEVMDYVPGIMYQPPMEYWDVIDKAIRTIQFNTSVQFQILIGYWENSFPTQWEYLSSLNTLQNVEVRYFIVPPITPPIPFTRVNHAKWMVTDDRFYVTTSNWVGDYFTNTAGVGTTIWGNPVIQQRAIAVFERDWNSAYSIPLPPVATPSPPPPARVH